MYIECMLLLVIDNLFPFSVIFGIFDRKIQLLRYSNLKGIAILQFEGSKPILIHLCL